MTEDLHESQAGQDAHARGPGADTGGLLPRSHWDAVALATRLPAVLDDATAGTLDRVLGPWLPRGEGSAFEAGCCPGQYLAYFATRFGLRIAGCDVSADGVELTLRNLALLGLEADLQVVPFETILRSRRFDVVASFGLIEHFEDWRTAVGALVRGVKPGGWIVTGVPNLYGLNGLVARWARPALFRGHVRIRLDDLSRALADLGCSVLYAGYTGGPHVAFPMSGNRFATNNPRLSWLLNLPFAVLNRVSYAWRRRTGVSLGGLALSPSLLVLAAKDTERSSARSGDENCR